MRFPRACARIAVLACLAAAARAWSADVPGVVIDHIQQTTGNYIGSPSIAILPNGHYVASHDLFGPKTGYRTGATTRVFGSADRGRSWRHLTDIQPLLWGTLFVHRKALYLIGTTKEYGDAIIRRSVDGGRTWTEPKDESSGLLLRGRYHCAPQPVIVHNGRIWRGMEDAVAGQKWGEAFRAFMLSAPADADLLRAENWRTSNAIGRDAAWLDGRFGGWLEGNAVVSPARQVLDILRVDYPPGNKAAAIAIGEDGRTATFDPGAGWIDLPGGATKFTIRYDKKSRRYWALVNWAPPRYASRRASAVRNTLALVSSADLRKWEIRCVLLHHPDADRHGFQYVDWQFDKNDMVAVSRTAWDDDAGGAHNFHDANFMTFHRVRNFRKLTERDSVVRIEMLR
jgi:hypothetical protein